MEKTNTIQERQVAYKVCIKDILDAEYSKEEGWNPNYIKSKDKNISRVNVIGFVVSKNEDNNFASVIIDDGSGEIGCRLFENKESLYNIEIGNPIILIGRPREYQGEKYILIETIKNLKNPDWIKLRQLELKKEQKSSSNKKKSNSNEINKNKIADKLNDIDKEPDISENPSEKIIVRIKELDSGAGADFEEVILDIENGEKIVNALMLEGEVFEVSPGKLKVLE